MTLLWWTHDLVLPCKPAEQVTPAVTPLSVTGSVGSPARAPWRAPVGRAVRMSGHGARGAAPCRPPTFPGNLGCGKK